MKNLLTAIQESFANSQLLGSFPTGCYLALAPPKAALPLCVLTIVAAVPDYSTCQDHYLETVNIQFTGYASDSGNTAAVDYLLDAEQDIELTFNRQSLNITDDVFIFMRKTSGPTIRPEDDKVWRFDSGYEITVSRSA